MCFRLAKPALRALFQVAILSAIAGSPAADRGAPPSLQFLIGKWTADAQADGSTGWTSFSFDLGHNIVVRKNEAQYPASKDRPASTHSDLMVIYAEETKTRADYFDSEGHVIRYAVTFPSDDTIEFLSDAVERQPRFRLTYVKRSATKVEGRFEIAPPGKPDAFSAYLRWSMTKASSSNAQKTTVPR